MTVQLTKFEAAAIKDWSTNYRDAEHEKGDNATWHNIREIAASAEIDTKQARGVVSSLVQKGLVTVEEDNLFTLTEAGIDAHYELISQ